MVLFCWQLHVGQQQYKGNISLCSHSNSGYMTVPQCYNIALRSRSNSGYVTVPQCYNIALRSRSNSGYVTVPQCYNIALRSHRNSGYVTVPQCYNIALCSCSKSGYVTMPQCCITHVLPTLFDVLIVKELCWTSWWLSFSWHGTVILWHGRAWIG
jgi:hypothetical protein